MEDVMKWKEEIENELSLHSQILENNSSVGMDGPLIDREGFPRDDVDVYAVRRARNRIICLRNDHKKVMVLIQEQLYSIHSEARERGLISSGSKNGRDKKLDTFAHVTMVTEGSPSSMADLRIGDQLIEFGSVSASNFTNMSDIATVVQHSVGRSVRVFVLRDLVPVSLSLTPRQWSGRGLLGCVISPTSS